MGEEPHHIRYQIVTGSGLVEDRPFLKCERAAYERHISSVCTKLPSPTDAKVKLKTLIARMNSLADTYARNIKQGKTRVASALRAQWNTLNIQRKTQRYRVQIATDKLEFCRLDAGVQAEKQCKQTPLPPGEGGSKGPADTVPGDTSGGGDKANDYGIKASGCKACDDAYLETLRGIAKDIRQKEREIAKRGYSGKMLSGIMSRILELQKIDSPDSMIDISKGWLSYRNEMLKEAKKTGNVSSIEAHKSLLEQAKVNLEKTISDVAKNRKKYQKRYDAARKKIAKLEKQQEAIIEASQALSDARKGLAQTKVYFESCIKQCKKTDNGDGGDNGGGKKIPDLPGGDIIDIGITDVINHGGNDPLNPNGPTRPGTGPLAQDTEPPVVIPPDPIDVDAPDAKGTPVTNGQIVAFLAGARATDNVGIVGPITNDVSAAFFGVLPNSPAGNVTTIKFMASDAAGNTGMATSTITVRDRMAPVLTLPQSITVIAEQNGNAVPASDTAIAAFLGGASANDNVDGTTPVTNNAPETFALGSTSITFTATDKANNMATGIAMVTVQVPSQPDTTPPVVTPADPVTVAAVDASGTPASNATIQSFLGGATANDDRDGALPASALNPPAKFPLGVTNITFAATDMAGNIGTATSSVTVADQKPPVLRLPDPIFVDAVDANGTPASDVGIQAFLNGASATDNVDTNVNVTHEAPATFFGVLPNNPAGHVTTVTFTAMDNAGNQVSGASTITVIDRTPPVLIAPGGVTVAVATGASTVPASDPAIVSFLNEASATDNVDTTVTVTNDAPAVFNLGTTLVTFTATDLANNTSMTTAIVTVQNGPDTTPPAVTPADPVTVAAVDANGTPASNATIQSFLGGATANDDRDGPLPASAQNPPAQFALGATSVTFAATDIAGNTGTASSTVTVTDQQPPELTLPLPITVSAAPGQTSVPASNTAINTFLNAGQAFDNVDGTLNATAVNPPSTFPVGMTVVTFRAVDAAGNEATGTSTVTVTAPLTIDGTFPLTCTPGNTLNAKITGQGITEMETILGQMFPTNPAAIVTGGLSGFTFSGLPPGSVSGTAFVSSSNSDVVQSSDAQGTATVNGINLILILTPTWFLDGTGQLSLGWRLKAPGQGFAGQTLEAQWNCFGFKTP